MVNFRFDVEDKSEIHDRAVAAEQECRRLLELPERTRAENEAMIKAAHASLHDWQRIGTFVEEQRGNRLVAQAYISAGLVEPALEFGRRAMEITAKYQDELPDYDRAYAKELAARAWALAGNLVRAKAHHADAQMLGDAIGDNEQRREFFRRFEAGPWFRLNQPE